MKRCETPLDESRPGSICEANAHNSLCYTALPLSPRNPLKHAVFSPVPGAILLIFALLFAACDNGSTTPDSPGVASISIGAQPAKFSYDIGGAFSSEGLELEVVYTDGSPGHITTGWTLSWNNAPLGEGSTAITESTGNQTVTVAYGGKTAYFGIFVGAGTVITIASAADWTSALDRISADKDGTSSDPNVYILNIRGNVSVPGVESSKNSISGAYKTVRLAGSGTLALSSSGSIFRISNNQTLAIHGPTLNGRADNTTPVVNAENSTVELWNGTITGNAFPGGSGGGVLVRNGTFAMSGGTVSGNTAETGGGVCVQEGTFTMTGGTISGNTAGKNGGGMYVYGLGTFTMTGGVISGNTAHNGSGMYADSSDYGDPTFAMSGGTISGNTAEFDGGGVYSSRTFTLSEGTISGNIAKFNGGGVYVQDRTFTMTGGAISGNTAEFDGGGMYVNRNGTFTKTGGIVYGDTDRIAGNGNATDNTATSPFYNDTSGHAALYNDNSSNYYRNETLADDANGTISSTDKLPGAKGETLNNWTKR